MTMLRRWVLALGIALVVTEPILAFAQDASVALPPVRGPRRSGAAKLQRGVVAGLAGQGVLVVYGKELKGAAKSAKAKVDSLDAARAADTQFQLEVRITRSRRKYFATATLLDVRTGDELEKIKKSYRRSRSATKIGRAIGSGMAASIKEAMAKAAAVAAIPEPDPDPEPIAPPPPPVAIEEAPVTAKADVDAGPPAKGGEDQLLRLEIGAGTQAFSAYTVAVGGQVTGLAYTLSPLMMINAGAAVLVPDTAIQIELDLAFVPVKYAIDVMPPVSPSEPTGRFLNVGAAALYRLELSRFGSDEEGRVFLSPLVGLSYNSMTVESQGENTVVVSWSAIDIAAGLRLGIRVDEQLAFGIQGRFGVVPYYDEGPTTTGDGGFGIDFGIGAEARYWLSEAFGISLGGGYAYQRVGLGGSGTRTPFVDDPPLEDATVFSGDLKIGAGVMLAL